MSWQPCCDGKVTPLPVKSEIWKRGFFYSKTFIILKTKKWFIKEQFKVSSFGNLPYIVVSESSSSQKAAAVREKTKRNCDMTTDIPNLEALYSTPWGRVFLGKYWVTRSPCYKLANHNDHRPTNKTVGLRLGNIC